MGLRGAEEEVEPLDGTAVLEGEPDGTQPEKKGDPSADKHVQSGKMGGNRGKL